MNTKFLPDAQLDSMASRLLGRYESVSGPVASPPVPIERIIEDTLDLNILWDSITESEGQSILAGLEPDTQTIVFNDARSVVTIETPGLYNTVLAHEAGHWELHVDHALLAQQPLPHFERAFSCLYRQSGPHQGPKEVQAHKFMSFLLMPSDLLLESVRDVDLTSWSQLYKLRDHFQVTITALTIRPEKLGLLYVSEEGHLYPSRQEFEGQLRLGQ